MYFIFYFFEAALSASPARLQPTFERAGQQEWRLLEHLFDRQIWPLLQFVVQTKYFSTMAAAVLAGGGGWGNGPALKVAVPQSVGPGWKCLKNRVCYEILAQSRWSLNELRFFFVWSRLSFFFQLWPSPSLFPVNLEKNMQSLILRIFLTLQFWPLSSSNERFDSSQPQNSIIKSSLVWFPQIRAVHVLFPASAVLIANINVSWWVGNGPTLFSTVIDLVARLLGQCSVKLFLCQWD